MIMAVERCSLRMPHECCSIASRILEYTAHIPDTREGHTSSYEGRYTRKIHNSSYEGHYTHEGHNSSYEGHYTHEGHTSSYVLCTHTAQCLLLCGRCHIVVYALVSDGIGPSTHERQNSSRKALYTQRTKQLIRRAIINLEVTGRFDSISNAT